MWNPLAASGRVVAAAVALTLATGPAAAQTASGSADQSSPLRRLTVADAVRLALEHNLGIQVARFGPQAEDLTVAQARAGWTPSVTSSLQTNSQDSPNNSFLAGAQGSRTSNDTLQHSNTVQQTLPWGGTYRVGWDASRLTTNSLFATFSPQLQSSLALSYSQPLVRGFDIDQIRYEVRASQQTRDLSDLELQQTLTTTLRTVRRTYWALAFATASLVVQRQSLALAEESLRNTRTRVEVGASGTSVSTRPMNRRWHPATSTSTRPYDARSNAVPTSARRAAGWRPPTSTSATFAIRPVRTCAPR